MLSGTRERKKGEERYRTVGVGERKEEISSEREKRREIRERL